MAMQRRRTREPDNPPAEHSLVPGELAVEMASDPPRLWVGVPTDIDETGRRQVGAGGEGGGEAIKNLGVELYLTGESGWGSILSLRSPGFFKHNGQIFPFGNLVSAIGLAGGYYIDGKPGSAVPGFPQLVKDVTYYVFVFQPGGGAGELVHMNFIPQADSGHAPSQTPGNEGVEVLERPSDPLYEKVVLLLGNDDGSAPGTTAHRDQSRREHRIYNDGYPPRWMIPPAPLPNGTPRTVLEFSGSNFRYYADTSTDWQFGTENFCMEAWVRPTTTQAWQSIFYNGNANAWRVGTNDAQQFVAQFAGWGMDWQPQPAAVIGRVTMHEWQHIAVYRVGNNFYGAKDGVPVVLLANAMPLGAQAGGFWVGWIQGWNAFQGQMCGIRVTKGATRYWNSPFTPPSMPLFPVGDPYWTKTVLLVGNDSQPGGSTTITDQSRLAVPITGPAVWEGIGGALPGVSSAIKFTPLQSYLTASYAFEEGWLEFGTGDFCVEGFTWISPSGRAFLHGSAQMNISAAGGGLAVKLFGDDIAQPTIIDVSNVGGVFSAQTWTYWAFFRRGEEFYVRVGGNAPVLIATSARAVAPTYGFNFGGWDNSTTYMVGYRVTKGASRYDANSRNIPLLPFPTRGFDQGLDDRQTLIGMVRLKDFGTGAALFRDGPDARLVRSWDDRKRLSLRGPDIIHAGASVAMGGTGGAVAEPYWNDGSRRMSWLQWKGEVVDLTFFGQQASSGQHWHYFGIGIDGALPNISWTGHINQASETMGYTIWDGHRMAQAAAVIRGDLGEGWHDGRPLVANSTTSYIYGANSMQSTANPRLEGSINP